MIVYIQDLCNLNLDQNTYYYFLPFGIGDAFMVTRMYQDSNLKDENICFIVQKEYEVVMTMNSITKYILYDNGQFEKRSFSWNQLVTSMSRLCRIPEKGKIYVCHPLFSLSRYGLDSNAIFSNNPSMIEWYKRFLGEEQLERIDISGIRYPQISSSTLEKIHELANDSIRNVIFILPEANSIDVLDVGFWNDLVQKLKLQNPNVKILTNKNKCHLSFVQEIDLTLEQLVAVCLMCNHVYSLRSGICDLIFSKGKELTVFYTRQVNKQAYGLNKLYGDLGISEIEI